MSDSNIFRDSEMVAALLRLEAKQVCRGFKSEMFPEMDLQLARYIRTFTPEALQWLLDNADKLK